MLYRTLKRMIERGKTATLSSKLDLFYASNKLTVKEYTELTNLLQA